MSSFVASIDALLKAVETVEEVWAVEEEMAERAGDRAAKISGAKKGTV